MSASRKTLVVTNDFPPRIGGIQSYLRDFIATQDPESIVVFASTQNAEEAHAYDKTLDYEVIRWPRSVMLPTPTTAHAMAEIIREREIDNVWFGAAAPLALMAGTAKQAGASKVIASTHGHEVGWSMLPGSRQSLRKIGTEVDVLTYISQYTLRRFKSAFGSHPTFEHLPSGVDVKRFTPATPEGKSATRKKLGFTDTTPVIACISRLVPRKGQDSLIKAMPQVIAARPDAQLLIVGSGRYESTLRRLATDVSQNVKFLGHLEYQDMINTLAAADIFAMPARTRGGGLDVEGLGIVYLEAQACGVPVIAGTSGGAPETVTPATGLVVEGSDVDKLSELLIELLDDPIRRAAMGAAGRAHVEAEWSWEIMGERLTNILQSEPR
ncbi:GDP-mannose-dependent monoacylated alpha-(1-6)-phosphatidylinositol monomannoside mannosyltransferase [Corynebacterium glutamicum]|uniref:GDP-mannose-dependent monoacylated alpha-(1-6)-phosphatidylinositol monomannoside mannosyltransferase n=1 Tax=Corynebacterium glutamicum TaxID=1718 RepID=UPI0009451004|nr:GDP-mannose-dependent monoacylated alpha-(1-6)-phosphatidylinositol monomannoside mannosyltransferase [Corynebacterium glutamicum]OKX86959.1 alpha-(1-2)-phosphatidylinositol mannosyltransferase [Corynebacterium glutamicum]QDX76068.1 alpha-(1-2)-phosphatidylinositol mannosyltransferase [Corynebacterium glutamicum]QDX78840.1 alpha-(1-2)-phosphatidylinositol mannosyltransferase [Corynebacterium glutamicum]TWS31664.1 alpha-(1-2)-phosphatidylinositol mannosyltransferase [Corynebacterium glutamicu